MTTSPDAPPAGDLRRRIAAVGLRDAHRLGRRLDKVRRGPEDRRSRRLADIERDVAAAEARLTARRALVPTVHLNPHLPVTAARDELAEAIRTSQVVVVAGETGSGKTTQLPQLCLELGRGIRGRIGHTQPRRIAARSVAARIGEELGTGVGGIVGYQVRFTDATSDDTLIKVMTDGILLAEIQRDPLLMAYDTVILDEAHERSLNIDVLMGYLHQLLGRRRDLTVIITSATIDTARFATHFGTDAVVEVSGRTYPVEVRYRPPEEPPDDDEALATEVSRAIAELVTEGPGDILVFCAGEAQIREVTAAVRRMDLRDTEVLPLFARLSAAEQQRIFRPHDGRRVVVSTNVAETSLTVPGIRYVVDTGVARISRFSTRTKVQRLPIEAISQASADQRSGRCGRVADGIAIRLYAEDDFEARTRFTDPEIQRTNLASVVLSMASLGIGDISTFPFLDPPDPRAVRDAVALLFELGAVTSAKPGSGLQLTAIGQRLADLPVDPRLGRMLIEADESGCAAEVLVLTAALSLPDVRERPPEQRGSADAAHARFTDPSSDFLTLLNLWDHLRDRRRELGSSAFRRHCTEHFLHHLRVREWFDLHSQLRTLAKEHGIHLNRTRPDAPVIHKALLAGLLSQIGLKGEGREYQGPRGTRFAVWPGSAVADDLPAFAMAAELVETSRLWARTVAPFDPSWAESLGGHLVVRTHGEPRWSARRGQAVVSEKVTLHGVPLVAERTVPADRVDAVAARDLFIRHALVDREWRASHAFLAANAEVLSELSDAEHRSRRRDVVVDDEALVDFYDARIPAEVTSGRRFDRWWTRAGREDPSLLVLDREALAAGADRVRPGDFPDTWAYGDIGLALSYRFDPGADDDGVTVDVPLGVVNRVSSIPFTWQVPGLRRELVTEAVRALPKEHRRTLVPIPDTVDAVMAVLRPTAEPLARALSRTIAEVRGAHVPEAAWDAAALPAHLRMTFRVVDGQRIVASGEDLDALRAGLGGEFRAAVAGAGGVREVSGQTSWTFGMLPQVVTTVRDGHEVRGHPALVDEGATVGVRIFLDPRDARSWMWRGTRRLLALTGPSVSRIVSRGLSNADKLTLSANPHGGISELLADVTTAAIDALMRTHGAPAWDAEGFTALSRAVAGDLADTAEAILADVRAILSAAAEVRAVLTRPAHPSLHPALGDARSHLDRLVFDGFVTATGRARLSDVTRYVQGIAARVARIDPTRDAGRAGEINDLRRELGDVCTRLGARGADPSLIAVRWQIEELAVSLHAQHLGTSGRVSAARIRRALAAAEADLTTGAHA